jgi:hypothetical protein
MLRGRVSAEQIIATVIAGRPYAGRDRVPDPDEAEHVISGEQVRDLVLGRLGSLSRPVVQLKGVRIIGDVDLSYRHWQGKLSLLRCRIEGDVRLTHAQVHGRLDLSGSHLGLLDISGARIDGALLFRREGLATRGVLGIGAEITGALNLSNSTFAFPPHKPRRWALDLFRTRFGDVFLSGAQIAGGAYLPSTTIKGNLRLQGATVTSRRALEGHPDEPGTAITLLGAEIAGAISLEAQKSSGRLPRIVGEVDLVRARCQALAIAPEAVGTLAFRLDGFAFDELHGIRPDDWLDLVRRSDLVGNQPYMFFAAHCAGYGLTRLRRESLVAMQERSAALPERRWWDRLAWRAWRTSVLYGYQPVRAIGWLALAAVLCALILAVGGDFLVRHGPGAAVVRGPDGVDTVAAMALDSILPFAGLGAKDGWTADPDGWGQTAWMALFVAVKFAGWGLAALGLASVVGLAKRE